jgi:hypothetical protein
MATASDAETINNIASDPAPSMPTPLSTSIQLLRGLGEKGAAGVEKWHDVAEVRELNGEDEEFLARQEGKAGLTYTEYMNTLLERSVITIGDLEVAKLPGIMNKLILADRDMLFLGIVRATYGVTRELRTKCPQCGAWNDVTLNLDEDFPIKRGDFDLRDNIKVKGKKEEFQLRLPNGEDTIEAQKVSKTDAELNTAMLARCSVFEEGKEPADKMMWARQLGVADRRKLVDTLLGIELGPDLEAVDTQCAICEAPLPILLDWVSLLLS